MTGGEDNWILKKTSHVAELQVLLHPMRGVVPVQSDAKKAKPKPKSSKPPKSAKAKAKSKGKGRGSGDHGGQDDQNAAADINAKGSSMTLLPGTDDISSGSVAVEVDGHRVTRAKYFMDDLLAAVRAALVSARRRFGTPVALNPKEADPQSQIGDTGLFYLDYELPILRRFIKSGVLFAIQKQMILEGRVLKRWSAVRPQLQQMAMRAVHRVTRHTQLPHCLYVYKVMVVVVIMVTSLYVCLHSLPFVLPCIHICQICPKQLHGPTYLVGHCNCTPVQVL